MNQSKPAKIAVIGSGQIGSRHLQAMALSEIPLAVEVSDPSQNSLDTATNRWDIMPKNSLIKSISFHDNIESLSDNLDVAIIASPSIPRRKIIEQLLEKKQVKYLILEKVLFPKLSDFEPIKKLLELKKVKAWVNCARRGIDFYKNLRTIFKAEKNIDMEVSGNNWGLGCNSIHFLDTYAFISGQSEFLCNINDLDEGCIDSKRAGYVEFTGALRFKSPKGILTLNSYRNFDAAQLRPTIISLHSENFYCVINESEDNAYLLKLQNNNWQWEKIKIAGKYISQLSQNFVESLILNGTCDLPNYDESLALHKVMLEGFLQHYNSIAEIHRGGDTDLCPIT